MDTNQQLMLIPVKVKTVRGHFSALVTHAGGSFVSTTITTQRKSHARAKEAARRLQVIAETEKLTGSPVETHAKKIDGVVRRWGGTKANQSDQ